MNRESIKKTMSEAIETYGADYQLNVAIEELSELQKEICKHKRGRKNLICIIEEMADCYIILEEMRMIFEIDDESLNREIKSKIERLQMSIKQEKRRRVVNEEQKSSD